MPFIGTQPEVGGYSVLDALTASATASYTLQKDSVNFAPNTANQLLVSLNGVIQKPGSSFTVSGSTLTFSSALASSDSIDFILAMGEPLLIGTPSDATVTSSKLASNIGISTTGNIATTGNVTTSSVTTASGDLTVDVAGDITLDADGGDIRLKDGGTTFAEFTNDSTYLDIKNPNSNQDIMFKGVDDGSTITALQLDMSDAGRAIFNAGVSLGGNSAANTLDDYEEGTWSPALGSAGSPSYGHQYGKYTKVGRIVHLFVAIHATNISGSGTIAITGLPFAGTENADSQQRHSILVANSGHLVGLSDDTARFRISGSTLTGVKGNSSTTYLQAGQLTSSGTIQFSGQITYFTT